MIDPLFGTAIAIGLACLLMSAARHKVASHAAFVAALGNYRLLPPWLVRPVAALLPVAEAALAIGWLAGGCDRPAAAATAALLIVYAAALAANLLRGRRQIDCGCGLSGAAGGDQPLSWWLVTRNLVLASLAGLAGLPESGRGPRDLRCADAGGRDARGRAAVRGRLAADPQCHAGREERFAWLTRCSCSTSCSGAW